MSHMTSTTAQLVITTITTDGARTVHSTHHHAVTTYVNARRDIARYIADNGLHRVTYGDSACLLRDGAVIGHYTIKRGA